ncbi:hypothetical protein BVY03_03910 [bacterium K02(2017)]|nr:hypothetical protein BVY03_03910 [bacterium K02(2017)]
MSFLLHKKSLFLLFLIILLTVLIYLPSLDHEFTNWDDPTYVVYNPYIKSFSLNNIKHQFTHNLMGNYHPLTNLSLAFDYALDGLNPKQYHLTNLILHLFNCLLVYLIIFKLFKALPIAFLSTFLFAIHPLHVESIAWVTERKDVLYAFFFFLSLLGYLKYLSSNNFLYLAISLLLFLCSLLSKGQAVSLSLTIILIDIIKQRKLLSFKIICEKLPFLFLSLLFGIITLIVSQKSGALENTSNINTPFEQFSFACYGLFNYFFYHLIPWQLSAFYPYPQFKMIYSSAILIIPLVLLTLYLSYKKSSVFFFGLTFFIANIILMLQFLPVGNVLMADRFTYVASTGLFCAISHLFLKLVNYTPKYKIPISILIGLYFIFLIGVTHQRISIWKTSFTLWTDTLNKYPDSYFVLNLRGLAYTKSKNYKLAIKDYNKAIQINPRVIEAYYNRGNAKLKLKDYTGALVDYNDIINISPNYTDAYINKAYILIQQNKYVDAIMTYDLLAKYQKLDAALFLSRGIAKIQIKQYKSALLDFEETLKIQPNHTDALYQACFAASQLKRYKYAFKNCNHLLSINKDHQDALFQIANLNFHLKNYDQAINFYNTLITLNKNYNGVYFNLGMIFWSQNKKEKACAYYKKSADNNFSLASQMIHKQCDN